MKSVARPLRRPLPALLALAATMGSSALAAPRDPAMARELLKEGYELSKANRCSDALPLLQRSVELDPQAKAFLNLARCEEEMDRYGDALKHWVRARDLASEQGLQLQRDEAAARLAHLEQRVPRVTLRLADKAPSGTSVRRDGLAVPEEMLGRAILMDPGEHRFEVTAPHHQPRMFTVQLTAAQQLDVLVEPGPRVTVPVLVPPLVAAPVAVGPGAPGAEPPRPTAVLVGKPMFYGGVAVGAAALVVGAVAGIATLSQSSLRDGCVDGRCPDTVYQEVESARRTGTVSTVAFGVAGVAAVTAAVGYWLGMRAPAPATAPRAVAELR